VYLSAPRIAVDLLGGDAGPEVVVDGALRAVDRWPDVELLLVGPRGEGADLLAARGLPELSGRVRIAPASQRIGMDEDPVRAVRARSDSTVRVASRLLRDGLADAMVSVGSTGAAMAAALFTLGSLPGVTRPPLAVVIPAPRGPVVLLDVGATARAGPELLLQFALAGAAYASVQLGIAEPSVGLLSVGSEPGKGDPVRKAAARLLKELTAGLPVHFAGNVESSAVALGGVVDVVVTDGFTGNVLLKGMEGEVAAVLALAAKELDPAGCQALARISRRLGADSQGGAVLLGVNGVVVVGHGSSSPAAVTACIGAASDAVRNGLLPRLTEAMAGLVACRSAAHARQTRLPA
jgi:glycerol-3-phosphate acyltransferase PlsX